MLNTADLENIAFSTHGYVGADLASLLREAGLKTIKRSISQGNNELLEIQMCDIDAAMTKIKPSAMKEV